MKHSILLSLLLFVCLGVFGQSSSVPPQKVTLNSLQSTIDSQQSTITTLQDSIKDLKADNTELHKELKRLEQAIEQYRDYVEKNTSSIDKYLTWWFAVLSIIAAIVVGGLGVLGPYLMNRRSEKTANEAIQQAKDAQKAVENAQNNLKTFQTKVQEATTQATTATAQAEYARTALANSLKQVQGATNQAIAAQVQAKKAENALKEIQPTVEEAAKKAKAIQYFVQALQESDENRAIELYTRCIEEDNEFAEAYNNRGFIMHKIGSPDASKKAMEDYTTAIVLFEKQNRGIYAEAYNNRGILHFEKGDLDKAKEDFDAAISKDYAEAYLNRGLLNYKKNNIDEAGKDFDNAIAQKMNFAEAYYIRGLYNYPLSKAENDIVKAKSIKNDVVEAYSNRSLLSNNMKILDYSINRVEYSKDMKKLIRVPKDKINNFLIPGFVTEIEVGKWEISFDEGGTTIEAGAFSNCADLNNIYIDSHNCNYFSEDGLLYSRDKSKLIAVPGGKSMIDIPFTVVKIGQWSFVNCTKLLSIEIPDRVTEIGEGAFAGCKSLTSIEIPNSVTKIGNFVFTGCTNLVELHLKHKKPIDLNASLLVFDRSKITLYVPKGSGEAYRNDEFYKKFKEIIEE